MNIRKSPHTAIIRSTVVGAVIVLSTGNITPCGNMLQAINYCRNNQIDYRIEIPVSVDVDWAWPGVTPTAYGTGGVA